MYSFPNLERVHCSMSSSNCCFLTCIQVSQEAGQVAWYSHLFQNFPQFIVIHTVTGFGIVNKAEVDVFLELSCFFDDPVDVGNLISGSSAFSKTSLTTWKFTVHVLLKPGNGSSYSTRLKSSWPFRNICICMFSLCSSLSTQLTALYIWVSLVAQLVKNPPAMQETRVRSLGWEDPLEKGKAMHSSILAWRIPWTEEPGRLQFIALQESGMTEVTWHSRI